MYRFVVPAILAMAMQASFALQTASSAPAKPTSTSTTDKVPATAGANKTSGTVAPTVPVITIHGLCPDSATKPGPKCETVVTRQEFDTVVKGLDAIGPPMLPSMFHSVAEGYTTTLLNYEAGKKAGVEHDPRFAEVMRLARMRAMGDMYRELMAEKARRVSPAEIANYYKNNPDKLEELTMRRVVLPRFNPANLKDEDFAVRARKLAIEIHDRAAKGEDLDALEKEACTALGIKDPPTTKMGPVRRGLFADEQERQLFALKPGEVTSLIEQASSFLIFKLEKRETPTLEQAKEEIVRTLRQQHQEEQEKAEKAAVKIEFNDQYLGGAPASGWVPASKLQAESERQAGRNAKAVPPSAESPK